MKQTLHKSPAANRSLWRHRDLRLVMPARALSYVGDALALFALVLRVHDQGSGTAGMAVLLAAFSLPPVLLMAVAGQVSDRFDSRRVLLASTSVEHWRAWDWPWSTASRPPWRWSCCCSSARP